MAAALEARIRQLELALGACNDGDYENKDLLVKIKDIEKITQKLLEPSAVLWKESGVLLKELDPGTALTHHQQISAPILYRKQEILANKDDFNQNMKEMADILHLLSISQDAQEVKEDQVAQAPILMTHVSEENQARSKKLASDLQKTQQAVLELAVRIDALVDQHQRFVTIASEKLVAFDEACQ